MRRGGVLVGRMSRVDNEVTSGYKAVTGGSA